MRVRSTTTKAAVSCILLLAACGDDKPGPAPIIGTWVADRSDAACQFVFDFAEDGTYRSGLACVLTSGKLAAEIERGSFDLYDDAVTVHANESSCGVFRDGSFDYRIHADQLTLNGADGVLVMTRSKGGDGSSAVIEYGCFDDDLSFTPMNVAKKP
jgi:hypothetical protein